MKEFIDKLIERLEDLTRIEENRPCDCDEEGYGDVEEIYDDGRSQGRYEQTFKIITIVNELAEEYKDKSNIIYDLKAFLKEKFKYNSEQAEIWRDGSDNDAYFRQQKDLYMDRANIYGEVMREIDRLAEEYKVSEMPTGWISVSERLPKADHYVLCQGNNSTFVACVDSFDGEWRDNHFYKRTNVKAWCELPAPYTEGE